MQSTADKISRGEILCCICSYPLKQPKILDCLDSFCLACLRDLQHCQDASSSKLTCPICSEVTIIKDTVDELPDDFTTNNLMGVFLLQDKLTENQECEIACQACDEEGPAISRCVDCDHFLCQDCQTAHQRMSLLKKHTIQMLDQLRSGEVPYKQKQSPVHAEKCKEHPNDHLKIFCDTCKMLLCTTCSILGHENHTLLFHTEAADKYKKEITELATEATANISKVYLASLEVDKARGSLDAAAAETKRKISFAAMKFIKEIKEAETKLRQQVDNLHRERIEVFQSAQLTNKKEVEQARRKLKRVDRLKEHASCLGIVSLKPKLVAALEKLKKTKVTTAPEEMTFMDFQEAEKWRSSIGDIMVHDDEEEAEPLTETDDGDTPRHPKRWSLKRQIHKFRFSITDGR